VFLFESHNSSLAKGVTMSEESMNEASSAVELSVMESSTNGEDRLAPASPPHLPAPPNAMEPSTNNGGPLPPSPHPPPNLATTTTTTTADTSGDPNGCPRVFLRYLNRFCAIITYPCMVLFTLVSLLMIVTFCIFPTLVCLTFGTCIYYCLMEDPIPLSVLLRYMLSPDADDNNYPASLYPLSQQRPVIQSKLIIRRVLKIDDIIAGNNSDHPNDYPRKHPFPIHLSTESKCLHFSEPLGAEESSSNNNSNSNSNSDEDAVTEENNETTATVEDPPAAGSDEVAQMPPLDEGNEGGIPDATEESVNPLESGGNDEEQDGLVEIAVGREEDSSKEEKDSTLEENDGKSEEAAIVADADEETGGEKEEKPGEEEEGEGGEDYFGIFEARDRGTTCDICLLEYQVGDAVAWSPNLDCTHTYHRDCVLDWLVRKPTCPNCRHDYLRGKNDENV
jgi:hypothetical protein